LFAAAEAKSRTKTIALPSDFAERVATVRSVLSEEAFALAWAEGQAMPLDEAVAYALGECDFA
jgi:hypothetical protein